MLWIIAALITSLVSLPVSSWAVVGSGTGAAGNEQIQGLKLKHANVDALVKTGPGFLHTVTCYSTDAAATVGSIVLYDNTAESGTLLYSWQIQALYYTPFTLTYDINFVTGLFVGFTTTADVQCDISWR